MSDFLKKAAGLFFTVDETEDKEQPAEKGKVKPQPPVNTSVPVQTAPGAVPDTASVEKFTKYFRELYDKSNLPGPDFYEFFNMVEAMGSLIAEEIKYPSVYAGFAGQVTKEKLLASASHYLGIMQQDRSDFERSLEEARRQKVSGRKAQIEKKVDEIKRLQEQISALNNEIVKLNQDAQTDEARLAAEQAAYLQQSETFRQKITTGVDRINQFIK